MFTGLSTDICQQAWYIVSETISSCEEQGVTNKLAGCMVALDPRDPYNPEPYWMTTINGVEVDAKYVTIAKAKARVTRKTKLSSSLVQTQFPYLYENGDTKWGGSTIDNGGLIVAFSGVQAVFDEMFAEMMASAIRALCRHEMTREGGVMNQDTSFIGEVV